MNFLVFGGSQGSIEILAIFEHILSRLNKISNLKEIFFTIQAPLSKQKEIESLLIKYGYKFNIIYTKT